MNIPNSHVSQERLSDYLNALALDPKLLASFRQNPQAALANSSLSDAEKSVVASCDEARLHHAISKGQLILAITVVIIVVSSGGGGGCGGCGGDDLGVQYADTSQGWRRWWLRLRWWLRW